MKCIIKKGPFAGVDVRLADLVRSAEESGSGALLWPVVLRHPIFVAAFKPDEGYCVSVTVADGGRQQTFDPNGAPYQDNEGKGITAEAKIFTATLTKDGKVIAQASTQQTLEVRKAWEIGENNAKSRLYESLGLPAAFQQHDVMQDAVQDAAPPPESRSEATTATVVQSLGVRAVPTTVKALKAPTAEMQDKTATREPQRPDGISPSMWAQLTQACARKGVPVPTVESSEDLLVQLSEVQNG